MLDPVALEIAEGKALQDAQGEQELEPLAGRRRRVHVEPAIGDLDRIAPDRRHRFEVAEGERPAELRQMGDDRAPERPAVEVARSFRRDRLECAGEIRLPQDRTDAGRVAPPAR